MLSRQCKGVPVRQRHTNRDSDGVRREKQRREAHVYTHKHSWIFFRVRMKGRATLRNTSPEVVTAKMGTFLNSFLCTTHTVEINTSVQHSYFTVSLHSYPGPPMRSRCLLATQAQTKPQSISKAVAHEVA